MERERREEKGREGMDAPRAGPPQNFWARTAPGCFVVECKKLLLMTRVVFASVEKSTQILSFP
jgi:hypothetical protein